MFYPFGTAVLVDLLLTSIIFPRIQTLAESVNDFDKKGIAFGGWSMKLLTAIFFYYPSILAILACMQSSQRMESDKRSMRKRDMLTIWLRICANGVKIFFYQKY